MDPSNEAAEHSEDTIRIVGPTDVSDVALIAPALLEIEASRRGLAMSLLAGADRAALIVALDRAEASLRRRLAV